MCHFVLVLYTFNGIIVTGIWLKTLCIKRLYVIISSSFAQMHLPDIACSYYQSNILRTLHKLLVVRPLSQVILYYSLNDI